MQRFETEVAIIGAGPAGSAAAGFLRLHGVECSVFEREVFPRFHIGESLLTMCVPPLRRLGLDLSQEPYARLKPGAYFLHEPSGESLRVDFAHALDGTFPHAFQVERQFFDHALARRAEALGARVLYGAEVKRWREDESHVELEGPWGECRARFALDATGQQALFGRRRKSVEPLDRFGKCASFSTFGRVRSELSQRYVGNGDILILLVDEGWLWLIPLPDERVSVGLVERRPRAGTSAESVLSSCIARSPCLSGVLHDAERIQPFRRIANYSYENREPHTRRCATVGDARAFLDPIFSSGVTIAITTAEVLAAQVHDALRRERILELGDYDDACVRAYTTFDRLIERFYRPEWVRTIFFAAGRDDRVVREFTALLAGDVWRDDNSIQQLLLGSRTGARTSPTSPAPR